MEKRYLSVTALTKYLKYKFDQDDHLKSVALKAEISNFKHHSRGHFYLTLKDENAQLSAVMFQSQASKLKYMPKNGMTVLVEGRISIYEPQGQYVIYLNEMLEDGVGSLYLAFEQLKEELEKAGYFDAKFKKPIPKYPSSIGVITSETGAAVRDIIHTINRRYPSGKVILYPSLVQGESAKHDIEKQIKKANADNIVDVLIVGRGGGSIEDLWPFNEKIVAEAIYHSAIPIISAVGHETDFSIADFVADMRAPTPTAAAEMATPDITALLENINQLIHRINKQAIRTLNQALLRLTHAEQRLETQSPINKLHDHKDKCDRLKDRLLEQITRLLDHKKQHLNLHLATLKGLDPKAPLKKGYGLIMKDSHVIKSIHDVDIEDTLSVMLADGTLKALVKERKATHEK